MNPTDPRPLDEILGAMRLRSHQLARAGDRPGCAADFVELINKLEATLAAVEPAPMGTRELLVAIDPANPSPDQWCSACGHVWTRHGSKGCTGRVDSAWTATNDRSCGCSATGHVAAAPEGSPVPYEETDEFMDLVKWAADKWDGRSPVASEEDRHCECGYPGNGCLCAPVAEPRTTSQRETLEGGLNAIEANLMLIAQESNALDGGARAQVATSLSGVLREVHALAAALRTAPQPAPTREQVEALKFVEVASQYGRGFNDAINKVLALYGESAGPATQREGEG